MREVTSKDELHETRRPDVETSSDAYARRFSGRVGKWFLEVQRTAVLSLLPRDTDTAITVLELGGGHGQLTQALISANAKVVVHGSDLECHRREIAGVSGRVVSDLWQLPFRTGAFDMSVGVRLLAHAQDMDGLFAEIRRVARGWVLFDFPVEGPLQRFAPALFSFKRGVESNTRPYYQYSMQEVVGSLERSGLRPIASIRQFLLPMAFHRLLRFAPLSKAIEAIANKLTFTRRFGSPALLLVRVEGHRPLEDDAEIGP